MLSSSFFPFYTKADNIWINFHLFPAESIKIRSMGGSSAPPSSMFDLKIKGTRQPSANQAAPASNQMHYLSILPAFRILEPTAGYSSIHAVGISWLGNLLDLCSSACRLNKGNLCMYGQLEMDLPTASSLSHNWIQVLSTVLCCRAALLSSSSKQD